MQMFFALRLFILAYESQNPSLYCSKQVNEFRDTNSARQNCLVKCYHWSQLSALIISLLENKLTQWF